MSSYGIVGGSLGLNLDFKVESRPLTQQGLMTLGSNCQGLYVCYFDCILL